MSEVAALAPCGLVLWLIGRRARLGARARATAGVRLAIVERVVDDRARLGRIAVGLLAGAVAAGVPGAAVGAVGGAGWRRVAAVRARRVGAARLDERLPDAMRAIGSAIRAGRSLPQAIEAARDEADEPARATLDDVARRLTVGAPFDAALEPLARASANGAMVAATLRVGRRAGANLPTVLDTAVEALEERARIARDRRAATAQARLSAAVVGAMPLAFFAIAGEGARATLSQTLRSPAGWALVVLGVALEAGGALWIRAMTRDR